MMELFSIFFILSLTSWVSCNQASLVTLHDAVSVNVISWGAVGDGRTDDSQAFLKAWESVCGAKAKDSTLVIPDGRTFLLKPVRFEGPCMSSYINVQIQGNVMAPADIGAWSGNNRQNWLVFSKVNWLTIYGEGKVDGQGEFWWEQADKLDSRPSALAFSGCDNLHLIGLTHINSANNHISVYGCNGVTISNLQIFAPESSPNTDGIDISHSSNVQIHDSIVGTGDDCVAINTESSNIVIAGVTCGPGHGISIGSLGSNGQTSMVEDVQVSNCTFKGTTNGARIKTWQGGSGYARRIFFENITLDAVANPIIIDQYYCGSQSQDNCKNQTSAVKVSDVSFIGVHGTSITEEAIQLSCSESVGCSDIKLNNIYITSSVPGKITRASCVNAQGKLSGPLVPSVDCLSQ